MKYFNVLLLIFLCLSIPLNIYAQCKNNIEPDEGIFHYRQRNGDDRCEGTYKKYRSVEPFKVVSYTAGTISYSTGAGGRLAIYAPEISSHLLIPIQGTSYGLNDLNSQLSYRLDMVLEEKTKKLIPLSEVINRIPIPPANFGIFGLGTWMNSKWYIPLIAIEDDPNNHYPVRWNNKDLQFVIFSNMALDEISYIVTPKDKNDPAASIIKLAKNVHPNTKLVISIPRKDIPAGSHQYSVDISYKMSGKPDIETFNIFIP